MSGLQWRWVFVLQASVIFSTQIAVSHLNHSNGSPDVVAQYVLSDPAQSLNTRETETPGDRESQPFSARFYQERQGRSDQQDVDRADLQGKFSPPWESIFRASNDRREATGQKQSNRGRYMQKEASPLLETSYRESAIPRAASNHRRSINGRHLNSRRSFSSFGPSRGESTFHAESNNPRVAANRRQSNRLIYEKEHMSRPLESSYRESSNHRQISNHRESSSGRQSSRRRHHEERSNKDSVNHEETTVKGSKSILYENPLYALTQIGSHFDRNKQWEQTEGQTDFSKIGEQGKERFQIEEVQPQEKAYYESGTLQNQPYYPDSLSYNRWSDARSMALPNVQYHNQDYHERFAHKIQPNDRGRSAAKPHRLRDSGVASSYRQERRQPYYSLSSRYRRKYYDSLTSPSRTSYYRSDRHLTESFPHFESHPSLPPGVGTYNPSQEHWQEGLAVPGGNEHVLSPSSPLYPWHHPQHHGVSNLHKSTLNHPSLHPSLSEVDRQYLPQNSGTGPPQYGYDPSHHLHSYRRRRSRSVGGGCWWQMVFKAVSGNQLAVGKDFLGAGNINKDEPKARDLDTALVFRDGDILDNWDQLVIEKVKIEVFDNGQPRAWFVFNGLSSTRDSWLAKGRLVSSNYKNIKSGNFSSFGFTGNDFAGGTFSIRRTEGTCAEDCGYLAVVDSDTSEASCDWESKFGHPRFLYSRLTDSCGHYEDPDEVAEGDRLLVSVRLCDEGL